jgi:hypothetical protein
MSREEGWAPLIAAVGGVCAVAAGVVAVPLVAAGVLLGAQAVLPRGLVDVLYPLASLGLVASPVIVVLFVVWVAMGVVSLVLANRTGSRLWWMPLLGLIAVAALVALPLLVGVVTSLLPAVEEPVI